MFGRSDNGGRDVWRGQACSAATGAGYPKLGAGRLRPEVASMRLRSRLVLVECLELARVSERELARRAGLSHSTVNHLCTGRRVSCSRASASAIERALELDEGKLFV